MNEKEIIKKKELVDKYLKKNKYLCLFDTFFYNIDNLSLYLRLDYIHKTNTYRISWVNLGAMTSNKVEDWINSSLVYPTLVDNLKNVIGRNGIVKDYIDKDKIDSKVIINSYLKDYNCNKKTFEFKRYIPKCWEFLSEALFIIFEGMPKYLYPLFQIMIEKIIIPDINSIFVYDLKKDNYDELFSTKSIDDGINIYNSNKIKFIEKNNQIINSIICDSKDYLVTIINNEKTKEVQMNCSCQSNTFCKHMYATLYAMKNKKEIKFYKITHVDDEKNVIDNLKNFNYLLCIGIKDDYFMVVKDFKLLFLPIIQNNKVLYKIIEDDNKKSLEKQLNNYIKKYCKIIVN